jgi:hypothetical protein
MWAARGARFRGMTKMAGFLCCTRNMTHPHICRIRIIHHTIEAFVQTPGARSQTKMAIPDLDLIKQEKQANVLAGASADRPKPTCTPIEITPFYEPLMNHHSSLVDLQAAINCYLGECKRKPEPFV